MYKRQVVAGGSYQSVQFHNNLGLIGGASNFVYDEINQRIGIGSTTPRTTLDVLGFSTFLGGVTVDNLNVTGIATISTLEVVETSTINNLEVTGVSTLGFLTGTNSYFTGIVTASKFVGDFETLNLDVGIATIGSLNVIGLTTSSELQVFGISTFSSQVDINNLNVTGVGTFDNIKIYDNNIETNSGNLILNSNSGITEIDDILYINDTTQSIDKDTGSLVVEGGVGIEKNLNVGGELSITGITTLSSAGGITTTGGDLYVGGNLYTLNNIFYNDVFASNGYFTGIVSTKDLYVSEIFSAENVEINNLLVSGISTFNGNVILGDDADTDTITYISRVGSGITPSSDNIHDLGSESLRWRNIYGTVIGDITGIADTAKKLETARNIQITGDLSWSVDFDGSSNVSSVGALSTTGVTSATYGSSTSVPVISVDSKGRITSASNVGINFNTATVAQSDSVKTIESSTDADFFLTFVDSNNIVASYENVYTDSNITYNPSTDLLTVNNATFNGDVILGDSISDTITFNSRVGTGITPTTDGTLDLGGSSNKWDNIHANVVYANSFVGGSIDNADTANRVGVGSTTGSGSYHLTFVDSNNSGDNRQYEFLFSDESLYYQPNLNRLFVGNIQFSSIYDLSDSFGEENEVITANGDGGWSWQPVTSSGYATSLSVSSDSSSSPRYLIFSSTTSGLTTAYVDSDITYTPSSNLLVVPNIKPASIQDSSGNSGSSDYVISANGSGGWIWKPASDISTGIGIATEGGLVGTGITIVDFRGPGISTITAFSGIATVNILGDSGNLGGNVTVTQTDYACSNPILVSNGNEIGIGSTSNAYGRRFVQDAEPTSVCDGDLWYSVSTPTIKLRYDGQWISVSSGNVGSGVTVISAVTSSFVAHSTTYSTTGLSASITPSSTAKKVLINVTMPVYMNKGTSVDFQHMEFDLRRNGTSVGSDYFKQVGMYVGFVQSRQDFAATLCFQHIDSPSSTSSVTYEVFAKSVNSTTNYWTSLVLDFSNTNNLNVSRSLMTLMEVD